MPLSVALGIHVVDVLVYPVMRLPGGQSLAFVEQVRTTVAGSAGGTAIDMAKLGLEVYSIGAIGEDDRGDFLISTMQKFGVDTSGIVRKPKVETSCSVLPIRPNGERPVLHLVGASGELTIEDIDFSVIAKADYLHLGGSPLMEKLDGEPAKRILKFAKEHGVVTTFDVLAVSTPNLTEVVNVCLPYVDYFMPNYEEAAMIEAGRYTFKPGKDELVRDGNDGFIVAFGDTLYRAIDAAETLKEQGYKVGVLNKPSLNAVDEEALKKIAGSGFVLVAETQNQVTGLGSRLGTWLLERGYSPRYKHLGIAKPGEGGGLEQVGFHGLEPEHLVAAVKELVR